MEKRLLLAIALALFVLLSWSAFVSKVYHIENKEVASTPSPAQPSVKPIDSEVSQAKTQESTPALLFKFAQGKYEIVFTESQAAIKEAVFKSYQDYPFPLKSGFFLEDPSLIFQKGKITAESVSFIYRDKDKEVIKEFLFSKTNYSIGLVIEIRNLSSAALNLKLPLILGVLDLAGDQTQARLKDVTFAGTDKIMHPNLRKDVAIDDIRFLGLRDRYFCTIIEPSSNSYSGFIKKIGPQQFEIGLLTKDLTLAPGEQKQLKFSIYLGPQELRQIKNVKPEWASVMYYGTFDFIAHLLLQVLDFIFGFVHNWGVTIIILSILIYFILYPLTLKQMRSMKQMQALQPRMEELKKIYKDNPQKLNAEIMKLYREYKVNPFSGCLPLILQIPVFFALYQVLLRSVALKGAKFLWIKDLSSPDRLFTLPVSIPFLGNEINLLPILMTIGMFIQQKFSMGTTTTTSAEQQKLMLILFPLMFGFIFYHMPSGLVLYWFINSTLMLLYQLKINRQR